MGKGAEFRGMEIMEKIFGKYLFAEIYKLDFTKQAETEIFKNFHKSCHLSAFYFFFQNE